METLLTGLRAAAEPTRLRLLAACAEGELTVSEIVSVLGQSQPRISRHLKLLCEAGLLDRFREGTWVFYRLARRGAGADLVMRLLDLIPSDDPVIVLDRQRLAQVAHARERLADAYFRDNAAEWDALRALHVEETEVEHAMLEVARPLEVARVLDIGTGTGRVLELFGARARNGAVGIDRSREMLAIARARLQRAGLKDCIVRQGDMYRLPFSDGAFDLVTIHQVLHYADRPARAIAEAARMLRPGGRLMVVDFAPHDREELRDQHAHRRLGFADADMIRWLEGAGLRADTARVLPGASLTVMIWCGAHRKTSSAVPAAAGH